MTDAFTFPDIDTSYWKTNDPEWLELREVEWSKIEPMFQGGASKSKKALTIIKRYFLKGDMPDFAKLKGWDNDEGHLDLFCFIWLHPSWDKQYLTLLRNAYVGFSLVKDEDILHGLAVFLRYGTVMATQPYSESEVKNVLQTYKNNQLLFEVLMGDLHELSLPEDGSIKRHKGKPQGQINHVVSMGKWLCNDGVHLLGEDCLYQYDLPLERWYLSFKGSEGFFKKPKNKLFVKPIKKALWRIHHFDIEKEGDTARTRFVTKIRKMLDERDFIPEFKQMWEDVKAGKIEVENPWER